jgi:hypothetical protein
MASFHLGCLVEEAPPVPPEDREEAGFDVRVKPAADF